MTLFVSKSGRPCNCLKRTSYISKLKYEFLFLPIEKWSYYHGNLLKMVQRWEICSRWVKWETSYVWDTKSLIHRYCGSEWPSMSISCKVSPQAYNILPICILCHIAKKPYILKNHTKIKTKPASEYHGSSPCTFFVNSIAIMNNFILNFQLITVQFFLLFVMLSFLQL